MGRRSSNLISYIPYDNRDQLRQAGGATGALRQIQDLGIFMFISGLVEPDDDETCFVTASGAWVLQSPSMDVIDAFLRPELEEMREDITTLQGGGAAGASAGSTGAVYGQAFYGFGSGTYTWTCPPGVTSVSAVCIGGGAPGPGSSWASGGGGGGGLGWKNNIAVVPGTTYTVQVGHGGDRGSSRTTAGGQSFFISAGTVAGNGGSGQSGGGFVGDGGGSGGNGGTNYGGGGAGGYSGNGGTGDSSSGAGGGGSGGGSYSSTYGSAGGGGVGPFGQGASGVFGGYYGAGGSGGEDSLSGENPYISYGHAMRTGGLYGGGGGGHGTSGNATSSLTAGGRGCVRIIWGPGRSFPSTGTSDY